MADTRLTSGASSTESLALTVTVTARYLWFGGLRTDGDAPTVIDGAVPSAQKRATSGSWSDVWSANSALTWTASNDASVAVSALAREDWSSACELPSKT